MAYYPVLFIALIQIIAFAVIVKNMEYLNEANKVKDEIRELSVEVMEALARTIDAKDQYTRGHSTRVAKYSRMIAEKMGLGAEQQESIYYMGLLLTSNRSYRNNLSQAAVREEILKNIGTQFDEIPAKCMVQIMDEDKEYMLHE